MATIHKCDKCNKIIKDTSECVHYISFLGSSLKEKYNFSDDFYLCENCVKPFAIYLKRFLTKKKTKKLSKK